jgi:hypothetical protein
MIWWVLLGVECEDAYEPGFINSVFQIESIRNILVK